MPNTPMERIRPAQIAEILRRAVVECMRAAAADSGDSDDPHTLFHSARTAEIKAEIVRAGKKLWERQYVDGNGGNMSARISPRYVLATPTLRSKGDLTVDDLSLIDLESEHICGSRPPTSEILLHLEIYKAVPQARAVVHCHPPYATAHAIAGVAPAANMLPEQEIFIGPVALSPYETPGTREFARTVLPFVRDHNTILLANHGVVCWADTVTHAEWFVEVVENYCKTIMIAAQIRPDLNRIPPDKIEDLLRTKQKLGLPDPRLPRSTEINPNSAFQCGGPRFDLGPVLSETAAAQLTGLDPLTEEMLQELVQRLSRQVEDFMEDLATESEIGKRRRA